MVGTTQQQQSIRFGVARKFAPDLSRYIERLAASGVDAFEIGFAFGIPAQLQPETVELAKRLDVRLSCHLPFWINLGNDKREKNVEYLSAGLNIANQLETVAVFHLGFYGGTPFDALFPSIVSTLREVADRAERGKGKIGIETTGKQKALGTVDEICSIVEALKDERFIPVVDWAHVYARSSGTCPSCPDHVASVLSACKRVSSGIAYFHGGGIEHRNGNETKHVSVRDGHPNVPMILSTLVQQGVSDFTYIVESPDSINDVAWLKEQCHAWL